MPLVEETEKPERPARRSRWMGLVAVSILTILLLLGAVGAAIFSENGVFMGQVWVIGLVRTDVPVSGGLPRGFSRRSTSDIDPSVAGRTFTGPYSVHVLYLNLERASGGLAWVDLSRCREVPKR